MKRMAESFLMAWYARKSRQPLIIRGARQVGKSTLVQLFCESQKIKLLEINLEKIKLVSLETSHFKIQELLDEVQLKSEIIIDENTLIFFDEIQESPKLIKALRYFYEERPELAVISAGSLLEITLNQQEFSFPVGRVEFYHLGPMSFMEFLWATGNQFLAQKIQALDFSEAVVIKAKELLQKYYYVGGMPRAVKHFVDEKSLATVRDIQHQIIQTYLADFPKYNSRINTQRVERVFYACAAFLGKKVIWQKIDPESKARETRRIVELLINARVLLSCAHANSNSIPLKGEEDNTIFKLYFLDVGLLNAILNLSLDVIDTEMKNNFNNKGLMAEQFVAQHLVLRRPTNSPDLHYWLRDKGGQKGEIDFVLESGAEIVPIEVKAASAGQLKSLFYFCKEKNKKIAIKLSLDPFDVKKSRHIINNEQVEIELIHLPQYAVEQLDSIIKNQQSSERLPAPK